jgi:O-antigen/teichoic acid export membrane protein
VFLERMHGNVEVGLFGAAQRLVTPLAYLSSTLQAAVLPLFVRRVPLEANAVRSAVVSLLRWVMIAGLVILLIFQLLGQHLVALIFGKQYAAATPVLQILMISVPLTFAINIAAISVFLIRRYRSLTFAWALSSIVAIAANWMLVRSHADVGGAYAVILSEATLLIGILWLGKEFMGSKVSGLMGACSLALTGAAVLLPFGWNLVVMLVVVVLLFPKDQRELVEYLQSRDSGLVISQETSQEATSIEF